MDGTTALAVLGLEPGASRHEIRSAFRAQAKLAHPDHDGAAGTFVALLDAYRAALRTVGAEPRTAAPAPEAVAARTEPSQPGRVVPVRTPHPAVDRPTGVAATSPTGTRTGSRARADWLAGARSPRPSVDVRDIAPRPVSRSTVPGRRPVRSFEHCLARALAA